MRALAEVAHAHGVPLIVDEAWGAHLAFHEALPEHALAAGADLVISSTHKIVGSLAPVGDAASRQADCLDGEIVDRTVTLTESTSPNSLLFASLDAARRLAATRGHELIAESVARRRPAPARRSARSPASTCSTSASSAAPASFGYDPLRLAVDVRGLRDRRLRAGADAARARATSTSSSPGRT